MLLEKGEKFIPHWKSKHSSVIKNKSNMFCPPSLPCWLKAVDYKKTLLGINVTIFIKRKKHLKALRSTLVEHQYYRTATLTVASFKVSQLLYIESQWPFFGALSHMFLEVICQNILFYEFYIWKLQNLPGKINTLLELDIENFIGSQIVCMSNTGSPWLITIC